MDDPRLQPAPETRLRELESRIETATADGSASVHDVVEWRQECLALAQIACHDDLFQLGRAACNLARAYLAAGMASSAVPHAERAESLLHASAARTESADLLPTALLALADSLASRASSLARAAGAAFAKKEGRADPSDASGRRRAAPPPPSRPARHQEARAAAGVPGVPFAATSAAGAILLRRDRSDSSVLYKRAADAYHRALVAAHEVFGKGHVECVRLLFGVRSGGLPAEGEGGCGRWVMGEGVSSWWMGRMRWEKRDGAFRPHLPRCRALSHSLHGRPRSTYTCARPLFRLPLIGTALPL
jgi:hypothetical protein